MPPTRDAKYLFCHLGQLLPFPPNFVLGLTKMPSVGYNKLSWLSHSDSPPPRRWDAAVVRCADDGENDAAVERVGDDDKVLRAHGSLPARVVVTASAR